MTRLRKFHADLGTRFHVLLNLLPTVTLQLPSPSGKFFWNDHPTFDGSRAPKVGLSYWPVADSGRATLEWWRAQIAERHAAARHWLTVEQEKTILERMSAS